MASFKGNTGQEWAVAIDGPTIMRIRQELDPKFLKDDHEEDNTYARLDSDPALLCMVMYALCEEQCKERGFTDKQFYTQLVGDAIADATEALLKAILFFIPSQSREILKAAAEKRDRILQAGRSKILAVVNDPELETAVMASLESQLDETIQNLLTQRKTATATPELSESPPRA